MMREDDSPTVPLRATEPPPAIELRNLRKEFGSTAAVDGVDLSVVPGAFLVLLGPSGCGKTTVLRMLAGLEAPTGGEILFGDRPVASADRGFLLPPGKRDVGLVFQSYALWPHMTVAGNVEWPLKVARRSRSERRERVAEVLALLGIGELADRYPGEISGGQQQRVAIARMIAPEPAVLLFDEPLSNLDAKLRTEMRTELVRVHRATGATSVYVTHDQVEAMTMATHVAVMRGGRVEQFGTPAELLEEPASPFVATFIGTPPANLFPCRQRDGRFVYGEDRPLAPVPPDWPGGPALLMYRPEHLRVHRDPTGDLLPADLVEATPIAGRAVVTVLCAGRRVTAVCDGLPQAPPGATVHLELPPEPAAVYPDTEGPEGE